MTGTADLASLCNATESLLNVNRESTFQRFKVGQALQQLAQTEFDRGTDRTELDSFASFNSQSSSTGEDDEDGSIVETKASTSFSTSTTTATTATTATTTSTTSNSQTKPISYPGDLAETGNMLETLSDLSIEVHDDMVQRFLTPLRQSSIQTDAARVVVHNYQRLVTEVGRGRASSLYYRTKYEESRRSGTGGERMSPTTTKEMEERGLDAKMMESEAMERERASTEQLKFVVQNFPEEVHRMRIEVSKVMRGVLLERARAQIAHERTLRLELERVRDALMVGDVIDGEFLKQYHGIRAQQVVPPPLPGCFEEKGSETKDVQPRFNSKQGEEGEEEQSTAAALLGKVKDWWG